ncbi:UNVERIFIED_CONTAM: hypothetical protein Scaly_2425400 [Sesamum calycinum]|uniref:RNase H type-1 domain-containing protein n=1 Tax=Sesamum calycinum TaxID=2727403 RepID=A0AAW2M0G8_9LAMI
MDSEHLEDGLTDEDRQSLCVMLTLEEVREAVFSIDLDSVAGPDGFGAVFFHTCWEIISEDVFGAVTEFFRGVKMPKGFTATTISLIPKTASPTCWSEYRPISLCNVTNKICMKLMTIRLGHVLPKVISLSQSGFVPGRLLSDNVLLAQELVHSLESRRPDANVVFKLDMAKAYDQGWAMTNLSHGGRLALIRSVLQATPLLQVIHPPKSVLITIKRNFNGFFWGSYNGLCPGLFHEVVVVRGKSSLWSEYLHGRYCRNLHPTIVPYNRNHSSVWHHLCRIRDVAEPFIFWTLGEGSVSFWYDNWFGEKSLAQLLHRDTYTMKSVRYYWHEGDWNVPRILRIILMPFAQTICQIPIAAGQGDKIVWTGSSTRDFSTKSTWEAIRQASPWRQLLTDVCHRSLRPTISVFLWRLFQDRIPVDARIRQKGFSFPSKCQCCERNAAKYRGVPFSTDGIILEVQRHLRTLYAARTLTSTQWKGDLHQSAAMGFIFRQQVPRAPSIVRWHAPSLSWFKFNTDSSSLGNPGLAGAAGIIRNSAGYVHLAYQFALGTGTSVLAELTAVWRGMELALTHGLAPLVVEVDATSVISLLKSRASGKWEVQHLIMRIICLQQLLVADVQHVFREANVAADHLAKEAASLQLTRVLHHDDITGVLRGILCLDRQGVPHLRRG